MAIAKACFVMSKHSHGSVLQSSHIGFGTAVIDAVPELQAWMFWITPLMTMPPVGVDVSGSTLSHVTISSIVTLHRYTVEVQIIAICRGWDVRCDVCILPGVRFELVLYDRRSSGRLHHGRICPHRQVNGIQHGCQWLVSHIGELCGCTRLIET
jgi:hypothetical protein